MARDSVKLKKSTKEHINIVCYPLCKKDEEVLKKTYVYSFFLQKETGRINQKTIKLATYKGWWKGNKVEGIWKGVA